MKKCAECMHYVPQVAEQPTIGGFCHRYPPTAQAIVGRVPPTVANPQGEVGLQFVKMRPAVAADEFCGEHRAPLKPIH